jgi:glycogen synthase
LFQFSTRSSPYQAAVEVEELEPTNEELAKTIQSMRDRGVGILYGRWLIEGAPRVLLIDTKTAYRFMDEWKTDLWNVAAIPSPPSDDETNEAIVFGYLVAWFLGEVCKSYPVPCLRNGQPQSSIELTTPDLVCLP